MYINIYYLLFCWTFFSYSKKQITKKEILMGVNNHLTEKSGWGSQWHNGKQCSSLRQNYCFLNTVMNSFFSVTL